MSRFQYLWNGFDFNVDVLIVPYGAYIVQLSKSVNCFSDVDFNYTFFNHVLLYDNITLMKI